MRIEELAKAAKRSACVLAELSTAQKNNAILAIAEELSKQKELILSTNAKEIEQAKTSGMNEAMVDRLSLQGSRWESLLSDVRNVASLPDPVGEVLESSLLDNGLKLSKKRVPIGVLGIIYESRPNVTVDVAVLALKTGNCALLRGGSETLKTNLALLKAIQAALSQSGIPQGALSLIPSSKRSYVKQLLKLDAYIDMVIPRGGASLHRFCKEESLIPVITGGIGICHLFVDESADQKKSLDVIVNAKTQRPSVCNALDTLLVHESIAPSFILKLIEALQKYPMQFRLDPRSWDLLSKERLLSNAFQKACEEDWDTEWLSLVLGIKIVSSLNEAIDHIHEHGSGHSDGILTENPLHAARFENQVDSASIYINASTRFTDGSQYGLGAEVAISTQKLHARGPMGLKELTTYKWIVEGNYHIRG